MLEPVPHVRAICPNCRNDNNCRVTNTTFGTVQCPICEATFPAARIGADPDHLVPRTAADYPVRDVSKELARLKLHMASASYHDPRDKDRDTLLIFITEQLIRMGARIDDL